MADTIIVSIQHSSWLRRIVMGLLGIVLLLAAIGFIYENISEARDRRFHPMPGRRVEIVSGGSSLYMHIDRNGQGSPTVVLDLHCRAGLSHRAATRLTVVFSRPERSYERVS